MIIHRYNKAKEVKLADIKYILFYGSYVSLANRLEEELCTISTNKSNLLPVLDYIEKQGAILKDLRENNNNDSDEV